MTSTIDGEIAHLREVATELDNQLRSLAEEHQQRLGNKELLWTRCGVLLEEGDKFKVRAAETRRVVASLREEMSLWNAAKTEFDALQTAVSGVEKAREQERQLSSSMDQVSEQDSLHRMLTLACLRDACDFLQKYLLPITCSQLTAYGAKEHSGVNAVEAVEPLCQFMLESQEGREKALREVCQLVDYRLEEASRLESARKTLVEQRVMDAVDLDAAKERQLSLLRDAFFDERQGLLRTKARLEAEGKEVEFHLKRGTMARRSTQLTPAEQKLHDKMASQQEENKKLLASFEALRSEKLQLEREAEASLNRLLRGRSDFQKQRSAMKAKVDEVKRFRELLEEEKRDWHQTRKEMNELIVVQQNKIRQQVASEALVR